MLPDLLADELRLRPRRWVHRFDDQRPFAYAYGRDFVRTADHTVWAHLSDGVLRSARSGRRLAYLIGDVYYDADTHQPVYYESSQLYLPTPPFGEIRAVRATQEARPHRTAICSALENVMIDLDAAACRNRSADLFYPEPGDDRAIHAAQRVCASCPVRSDCLALALATPSATGIWGGLTEKERAARRRHDVRRSGANREVVRNRG